MEKVLLSTLLLRKERLRAASGVMIVTRPGRAADNPPVSVTSVSTTVKICSVSGTKLSQKLVGVLTGTRSYFGPRGGRKARRRLVMGKKSAVRDLLIPKHVRSFASSHQRRNSNLVGRAIVSTFAALCGLGSRGVAALVRSRRALKPLRLRNISSRRRSSRRRLKLLSENMVMKRWRARARGRVTPVFRNRSARSALRSASRKRL